jgi:hypothetical protein
MCGLLEEESSEGEQGTGKYNGGKYDTTTLGTCMKM